MARHAVDYTYINALFNDTDDNDLWDAYMVNIRDRFRDVLDGTDFVVSDIIRWQGSTSGSGRWGNAFVIKKGSREWLLAWGRSRNSTSTSTGYMDKWFNTNRSTIDEYFRSSGFSASNAYKGNLCVHYNSNKGSYNIDWDDPVELTYSSGDFTTPSVTPWSNISSFMPQGALRGVVWTTYFWSSDSSNTGRFFFVFDDEHDYMTIYATDKVRPYISYINIFGSALQPFNDDDLNEEVAFFHSLNFSTSSGISTSNIGAEFFDSDDDSIVRAGSGDRIDRHDRFRYTNLPRIDGTWPWNSVGVSSDEDYKGWFKTHVMRVIGSYDTPIDYYRSFNTPAGPLVKYHRSLAYPWVDDKPAPPYPDTGHKKNFDFR